MCDSTEGSLCPSPWKYIKVCGYSDPFSKNLNQRSLTPRWLLTPHLLRSHMWLYWRITVSKSHENTSKYWTKGHRHLDDLWPHSCWGHMCDSTQVSLCPSPIGIHKCMWIVDTVINFANYHIHTTYYVLHTNIHTVHTTYRMSDLSEHSSGELFWTQFRQDNKLTILFCRNNLKADSLFKAVNSLSKP